jgi:hypothetical protein
MISFVVIRITTLKLLENNNPPWYKGLLRQVLILNMVVRFHQGEQSKVVEFDYFKKKVKSWN